MSKLLGLNGEGQNSRIKLSALRELAGESMAAPCVALALSSLIITMGGGIWGPGGQ